MNGCNILCSFSTVIFPIKQKNEGLDLWSEHASPSTQISLLFFFFLSRNPVRGWLVGLSPAFYWWQWMLMHDQSNQMSCNTFVPFSGERTQESLVTVTRPILQLKPVPIWITFCKSETAKLQLIYCQINFFVHYRLSHSAVFSVLPVSVWVWWGFLLVIHLGAVISVCFSPFRSNVDSVPQLAQINM